MSDNVYISESYWRGFVKIVLEFVIRTREVWPIEAGLRPVQVVGRSAPDQSGHQPSTKARAVAVAAKDYGGEGGGGGGGEKNSAKLPSICIIMRPSRCRSIDMLGNGAKARPGLIDPGTA